MTSHVRHRGTTKVLLYHFFRTKYDEISNNDSYYKINVDIYICWLFPSSFEMTGTECIVVIMILPRLSSLNQFMSLLLE